MNKIYRVRAYNKGLEITCRDEFIDLDVAKKRARELRDMTVDKYHLVLLQEIKQLEF